MTTASRNFRGDRAETNTADTADTAAALSPAETGAVFAESRYRRPSDDAARYRNPAVSAVSAQTAPLPRYRSFDHEVSAGQKLVCGICGICGISSRLSTKERQQATRGPPAANHEMPPADRARGHLTERDSPPESNVRDHHSHAMIEKGSS